MVFQQGLGITDVLFGSDKNEGNHSLKQMKAGGIEQLANTTA